MLRSRILLAGLAALQPVQAQVLGNLWQIIWGSPSALSFSLIDTDTENFSILPLDQGDTIDLSHYSESLTLTALVTGRARSVVFSLGDIEPFYIDNGRRPYSLAGSLLGNLIPVPELLTEGRHTVCATPYTQTDARGEMGTSACVTFTTVDSSSVSPTLTPTLSMEPTVPGETASPTEVPIDVSQCSVDPPAPVGVDTDVLSYPSSVQGELSGELYTWHKLTLGLEGPWTCERANPNPFLSYRLSVDFRHTSTDTVYTVPGYYAADGNAANTGASSGRVWLAHFSAPLAGDWEWTASFTRGEQVAVTNGRGLSGGYFDGAMGTFSIQATTKTGRDLRGKGLLEYVGEHHLQFAETGEWFLKAGADAPENFLAYDDFDATPNYGDRRKAWSPHAGDYRPGDPTWSGGRGTEIIGAVNYLADQGMNVFSFLTMNIGGDDRNVFPYVSDRIGDRLRIDCSKTAQWEVVFEHATQQGMYLHFKTQETENDQLLDGGELGTERRLYYRELVARFGHHLALNWNLGEENTNTESQIRAFSDYFRMLDPYQHPIVMHTYPNEKERRYASLVGENVLDGLSLQSGKEFVFRDTLEWVRRSAESGSKWVVANDEQGSALTGVPPDDVDPSQDAVRKEVLWGNLMAGGAGVEYYFGYNYPQSDLTLQDFRSRANMWTLSKHALDFFALIPFWNMSNQDVDGDAWCLKEDSGDTIVLYLRNGGTLSLDLDQSYSVDWYDPRNGGMLQSGSVESVSAGAAVSLGEAPSDKALDWAVLLQAI